MFKRRMTKKIMTCKEFLDVDKNRLMVSLVCLSVGASMLASVYLKVPNQQED